MLKDHFIPHAGNAFQPYFLRFKVVFALLMMVLILEGSYLLGTTYVLPRSDNFAAIFATVLIEQTNTERTTDKLHTLAYSPTLERAAKLKAEDMATKGYFAHNSPEGKTPWYFFREAGYDYAAAGENLAVNFIDSKDVTDAWMRSPSHRANIMNGNYTEVGIATAVGMYKGKSAIFVVQEFGRPSFVARDMPSATSTSASLLASVSSVPLPQEELKNPANITDTARLAVTSKPIGAVEKKNVLAPKVALINEPVAVESSKSVVAGTGTEKLYLEEVEPTAEIVSDMPEQQLSAQPVVPLPSSMIEKIIASPRNFTTNILLLLAALLTLALGLAIFIKIRVQYPHMLANTFLLITIILSIVLLNFALEFTRGAI